MRILFPYLARWRSANYSRYHHLLRMFVQLGHHVTVLNPPPRMFARETNYVDVDLPLGDIELVEVSPPAKLWHHPLPADKLIKKGLAAWSFRSWYRNERLRRQDYDVLFVYNLPHLVLLPYVKGAVVVFDVADDLVAMLESEVGTLLSPLARLVARLLFRYMMHRASLTVSASYTLADKWDSQMAVVPNGVDGRLISQASGETVRARYEGPIVAYVGAFEYFVNIELMFDVAERLPHIQFLMVGGGRELTRARNIVERRHLSNVHFTGPLPYSEALEHMAACDVGIIPFRKHPVSDSASPLKLFEYTALGKPVICTPLEEVREIAGQWVFWAENVEQWVEAISFLLNQRARMSTRLNRARAWVLERYDWARLAQEYLCLIEGARRT